MPPSLWRRDPMEHLRMSRAPPSDGPRPSALRPLVALVCNLTSSAAMAHTPPKPIAQWGPFRSDTVPCLQKESRVTYACFDMVYDTALACRDAQARGQPCDMSQVEAVIDSATL